MLIVLYAFLKQQNSHSNTVATSKLMYQYILFCVSGYVASYVQFYKIASKHKTHSTPKDSILNTMHGDYLIWLHISEVGDHYMTMVIKTIICLIRSSKNILIVQPTTENYSDAEVINITQCYATYCNKYQIPISLSQPAAIALLTCKCNG